MTAGAAVQPTPPQVSTPPGEVRLIPLTQLIESPWNPRKHFDPAKLAETAASLRVSGQLTPIVVRPYNRAPVARYEIGAGHRRFRAAPLADEVLAACLRGGNRSKADPMVTRGQTAEAFLRHAAFQLYADDVDDLNPGYWGHGDALKNLREVGVDAAKIVDQVAPKPAKPPAKKKGGRK